MKINNTSNSYQAQFYKNSNTSFKGLTAKLSKSVYDKEEVFKLYKKYESKSHGKIGRLPSKWIYSIPFEKRPETIKEIFINFGKICAGLRDKKNSLTAKIRASIELTKLFQRAGVLKKWQVAKLKYINSGNFGDVYKLKMKGDSFALKIYECFMISGWSIHKTNGNFFEQPLAQYMKGKIPQKNNNWFKFYFGDLKNGIMVSKFEKHKENFTGKPFVTEKIGILVSESEQYRDANNIKGIIVDNGCVDIMPQAKNKTLRYIYSKAIRNPSLPQKILEETLKWKPSQIYNERLKSVFSILQTLPEENAAKCLNLLLPAADKEVSLYIANNIYFAPFNQRKNIFYSLYKKNDKDIDTALAKKLECMEVMITKDSQYVQALLKRNNNEINRIIGELY